MAGKSSLGGQTRGLSRLSSTPIPKALVGGVAIVLGILVYGLVLLHRDQEAFLVWIREDGLVEWLTVVVLLIMSAFSGIMSYGFGRAKPGASPKMVWLFLAVLFFFGAMEEISWGQRILGIESPQWFLAHNRQGETNLHNLVILGVNINKLVFGKILAVLIGIYLLAVPLAYRLSQTFRDFITRWGIPIVQNYQILIGIIVVLLVQPQLRIAEKAGELRELCMCLVFLLVLLHPYNQEIFPLKAGAFWGWKAPSGE